MNHATVSTSGRQEGGESTGNGQGRRRRAASKRASKHGRCHSAPPTRERDVVFARAKGTQGAQVENSSFGLVSRDVSDRVCGSGEIWVDLRVGIPGAMRRCSQVTPVPMQATREGMRHSLPSCLSHVSGGRMSREPKAAMFLAALEGHWSGAA